MLTIAFQIITVVYSKRMAVSAVTAMYVAYNSIFLAGYAIFF